MGHSLGEDHSTTIHRSFPDDVIFIFDTLHQDHIRPDVQYIESLYHRMSCERNVALLHIQLKKAMG